MLNKTIYLAAFAAFAFGGVYADEQISEEPTVLASDVQDSDDELLGRCPCRDKKKTDVPPEETILVCGCDEEGNDDGIVHAFANLSEDEESTVAHHGDEGEHELACDDTENDAEQIS